METVLIIIGIIVFISFFKQSIRKTAKYVDQVVVTNINEGQHELISRSTDAINEIISEYGEDFQTPDEIYNRLNKRRKIIPKTGT